MLSSVDVKSYCPGFGVLSVASQRGFHKRKYFPAWLDFLLKLIG